MTLKNLHYDIPNINLSVSAPVFKERHVRWTAMHTYPTHSLFYVLDGSFVLTVDTKSYIVRKHQMALLPANQPHAYWLTPQQHVALLAFTFTIESEGRDLLEHLGCTLDNHVVPLPEKDVLDCYNKMSSAESDSERIPRSMNLHTHTCRLITMYIQARIRLENAAVLFPSVLTYMQNHLHEDVSLKILADMVHLSPVYFCNKFKADTGFSPIQYFSNLRVMHAAQLLHTTDMPLKKIAAEIGMQDVYYFKSFFYKHIGVRPEQYRETLRRPADLEYIEKSHH